MRISAKAVLINNGLDFEENDGLFYASAKPGQYHIECE